MRGNRGISSIVATVLIVLITVASVMIIWVGILPMVGEIEEEILVRLEIKTEGGYTFYDEANSQLYVQVFRGVDDFDMSGLKILVGTEGNSIIYPNNPNFPDDVYAVPGVNGEVTYVLNVSEKPDFVAVAPLVINGGIEKELDISDRVNFVKSSSATVPISLTSSREGHLASLS